MFGAQCISDFVTAINTTAPLGEMPYDFTHKTFVSNNLHKKGFSLFLAYGVGRIVNLTPDNYSFMFVCKNYVCVRCWFL
jgi:hypothetical protein